MRPKGKFGLRSGNTFHFGGKLLSSTLRHSRDQHVIVKSIVDDSSTDFDWRQFTRHEADLLRGPRGSDDCRRRRRLVALASQLVPDGDLPFDDDWRSPVGEPRLNVGGHVSLTLNKRRRWLLPALIDNAIDELRQNCLELELSGDASARPASIRITHSTRLIVPRLTAGPFRSCSTLAADCVSYGDSAPTAKRRVVPRRHKFSFYSDLRRVAGGDVKPQEQSLATPRQPPRTHTRGVQRLSVAKRQRSLNKR